MPDEGAIIRSSVMIVDDDPADLELFRELFQGRVCRTFLFNNGRAALNALDRVVPDVILLDIRMPDMDGFEVCRRIQCDDRLREIPVIFISALPDMEIRLRAFSEGAVDYVMKPFRQEKVFDRIRVHLALAALEQERKETGQ
jgi:CheY-like chemotaxis protein